MKVLTSLMVLLTLSVHLPVKAEDLLADSCEADTRTRTRTGLNGSSLIWLADYNANTCRALISAQDSMEIIGLTLISPALLAMRNPEMAEILAADALTAGITLSNPVVLTVAVTGSMIGGAFYYLVRVEANRCRDQALQERILQEVERRTGLKANRPIQIKTEGL